MKKTYLNTLKPEEVIKRLKAGEVVKKSNVDYWKLIDGIIVMYFHNLRPSIGMDIDLDDVTLYFEEENQFEITGTGVYRTRDGRRAYVCDIDTNGGCTFVIDGMRHFMYHATKQGRCHKNIEYGADIVAKW